MKQKILGYDNFKDLKEYLVKVIQANKSWKVNFKQTFTNSIQHSKNEFTEEEYKELEQLIATI
jgi:DNA-binding MurR/RpiR family transcriptional regulator